MDLLNKITEKLEHLKGNFSDEEVKKHSNEENVSFIILALILVWGFKESLTFTTIHR